MKKLNKKGFTIVELVIVIAVIAILAAVMVPIISILVNRAHVTNDTQLVRNLNTALAADAKNGKHITMQSALDATEAFGYDVGKINASAVDNLILWDSVNDVFCYYQVEDGNESITYIPNSITGDPLPVGSYKLWLISSKVSNVYSTYYTGNATSVDIVTGFDAGKCTTLKSVNYTNPSADPEDAKSIVIRTNAFATKLTINGNAQDEVKHFGFAGLVDVQRVAIDSYEEYGTIGRLTVTNGHVAVKNNATVYQIFASTGVVSSVSIDENANVYDKDGAKVEEVIVKATDRFVEDAPDDCAHTDSHTVIDGMYMYEVCDYCGYTVITIITNEVESKKTVSDGSDNVITPIQTYSSTNVTTTGAVGGDVVINENAEPEVSTPVIDQSAPADPTCAHTSWTYVSIDEDTHMAKCKSCGLTYTEAHNYVDNVCSKCNHNRWVRLYWSDIEAQMTVVPAGYVEDGDDILISTNMGFGWFAKQVNNGNTYSGKTVKLTANIDLLEYYWTWINGFRGTFNGQNYTISNLYVEGPRTGSGYGLFGNCPNAVSFSNLTIRNVYLIGNSALGALVGETNATIDNVHVTGHIEMGVNTQNTTIENYNSSYVGGIVGHGYMRVSNSSVVGDDSSFITDGRQLAGIVGFSGEGNRLVVSNCLVENLTISGTNAIAGVIGYAHYQNDASNCTVRNVTLKSNDSTKIGFITGTTTVTNTGNDRMEFLNMNVEDCSLFVNDVFVTDEVKMRTLFATGYGENYAKKDNDYIFFENAEAASSYVSSHDGYVLLKTSITGQILSAADGATIVLDGDYEENRIELIIKEAKDYKEVTIDLNGYTVTTTNADALLVKYGKITLIDSKGTGEIIGLGGDELVWLQETSTLQIDSGHYTLMNITGGVLGYGMNNTTRFCIINGGTFDVPESKVQIVKNCVSSGSTVIINGESYTAE